MILLDMEMPKSCADCRINTDGNGRCGLINSSCMYFAGHNTKPVYCPIKAEIPKDATNGDVFEAMFPWIKSEKDYENSMVAILVRGHKAYIHFDIDWWDAPWKGQENAEQSK